MYIYTFVFFFFFQAEDGIRDLTVTGVQTCALPISQTLWPDFRRRDLFEAILAYQGRERRYGGVRTAAGGLVVEALPGAGRSEERRVGKECRSRWSPYH